MWKIHGAMTQPFIDRLKTERLLRSKARHNNPWKYKPPLWTKKELIVCRRLYGM